MQTSFSSLWLWNVTEDHMSHIKYSWQRASTQDAERFGMQILLQGRGVDPPYLSDLMARLNYQLGEAISCPQGPKEPRVK